VTVYAESKNNANGDGLGNSAWRWTHLCVNPGDLLVFSASGMWQDGNSVSGPAGSTKPWPDNFLNLADLGVDPYQATTSKDYWDALVGYIGPIGPDGIPSPPPERGSYTHPAVKPKAERVFPIFPDRGTSSYLQVSESGCLWLAFNADAYSNYTVDNSGQVEVTIVWDPGGIPCPDVGQVCGRLPQPFKSVCNVADMFVNGCGSTGGSSGPPIGPPIPQEQVPFGRLGGIAR